MRAVICTRYGPPEVKPVIDRRYRLEEIVEAYRYVELGRKKGNVIVTIGLLTDG